MRQEGEEVLTVSAKVDENCIHFNGMCSETNAVVPASLINIPEADLGNFIRVPHNDESEIDSIYLPGSDVSASSPLASSGPSSLPNLKYYYLFRPNDHDITVRIGSATQFKCSVCNGVYKQKFSLKRHFLRCHVNTWYISKADLSNCKISVPGETPEDDNDSDIGKTAKGRKKFKSSNAIFLANNDSRVMPGLYKCHMCISVSFDLENELRSHYNGHSEAEKSKFQCDLCEASFYKKQLLSRHLSNHAGKTVKKKCKKCEMEFSSKTEYQSHMSTHAAGRMCKYCAKILSNPANRKRHEALHLGVKPYSCVHCGIKFSQSKDLDRHFRKRHKELCRICPVCDKLLPSQESLELHQREKHFVSSKKTESVNNIEETSKPNPSKPATVPDSTKMKTCYVCKKTFQTFYAMMKHKTQAHPYHSRRRKHRRTVKQKLEARQIARDLSEEFNKSRESSKGVSRSDKIPESNHEQRSPAVNSSKQNFRVRPRFPGHRRHKINAEEEEAFYLSLSQNIAKNLCNHVVGTKLDLERRDYNFKGRHSPVWNDKPQRINWSKFNFPANFDVDFALESGGHEVQPTPENLSDRDLLYATGLNRVYRPPQTAVSLSNDGLNSDTNGSRVLSSTSTNLDVKQKSEKPSKLIGRNFSILSLCSVCKEKFESKSAFEEHCLNNHPNVDCSCFEIEVTEGQSSVIPTDLYNQKYSEKGVYFACSVPPVVSQTPYVCTKCNIKIECREEFHSHIVECGGLNSSSSSFNRFSFPKRILETRGNKFFRSSCKSLFRSENVRHNQKIRKSTKKTQFYKGGRLQRTSLTVNKNYFNTKPGKPVKTPSKRGRKSYEALSIRYKNSRNQAANSVDCSECKESFNSQAALNIHLQNHNRTQEGNTSDIRFNNDLNGTSSAKTTPKPPTVALSQNKIPISESKQNSSCVSKSVSGPSSMGLSTAFKTFPVGAKNNCSSNISSTHTATSSPDAEISDTPMDLSKSSKSDTISNLSNENDNPWKSALAIAMEAVYKYKEATEKQTEGKNEHISKLVETIEKLPASSQFHSVVKPNVNRKVGRPKKVKRLIRHHSLRNFVLSEFEAYQQKTNSKPVSKLEETVKRLAEIKAKSDKSKEQIKDISTDAAKKGNLTDSPHCSTQNKSYGDSINKPIQMCDNSTDLSPLKPNGNFCHSTPKTFEPVKCGESQGGALSVNSIDKSVKPNIGKNNRYENDIIAEFRNEPTSENSSLNSSNEQRNASFTNSSDDSLKTSDKSRRTSGSQGRISPSLESIVNSIKQKLHSQEQESSPPDGSVITWLEDDKFEIPPSRPKLKVPENSSSQVTNTDSASMNCENIVSITPSVSKPEENTSSLSNELQTNSQILSKNLDAKSSSISSKATSETNNLATNLASSICQKLASALRDASVKSSLGKLGKQKNVEPQGTTKVSANEANSRISDSNLLSNKKVAKSSVELSASEVVTELPNLEEQKRSRQKTADSVENKPNRSNNKNEVSQSKEIIRRRPGRPKKNTTDQQVRSTSVSERKNLSKLNLSNQELSGKATENSSSESSVGLNKCNDAVLPGTDKTSNLNVNLSEPEHHSQNKTTLREDDLQMSNSSTSNNANSDLVESNFVSSLKETRQIEPEASTTSTIASELGKNLASRMKENLRLSFENASIENQLRSEKSYFLNLADGSALSDGNTNLNEFYTDIKIEFEGEGKIKDPQFCPFCRLEFKYLTNFKRHLKMCKANNREIDPPSSSSSSAFQYLPKKDEVDYSMLNLLRHQSRQSQIIKEAEKNKSNAPEKNFSFTCNQCNRIYLSLYKLMQHKMTHKLESCDASARSSTSDDGKGENKTKDKYPDSSGLAESDKQNDDDVNKNAQENSAVEKIGMNLDAQNSVNSTTSEIHSVDGVTANSDTPNELCDILKEEDLKKSKSCETEASDIVCMEVKSSDVLPGTLPENSNASKVNVKGEEQSTKRKRGRPFGWRKAPGITPEPVKKRKLENNTENVLLSSVKRKAKDLDQIKVVRKKKLSSNLKPSTIPSNEKLPLPHSTLHEMKASTPSVSDESTSVSEKLKNSPKRLAKKNITEMEAAASLSNVKVPKSQQKPNKPSSETNQSSNQFNKINPVIKRGRGRPPSTPSTPGNSLIVKSESSGKRRPGRPPKNLLCAPSTSQTNKSSYSQSSNSRNYRKMMAQAIISDSSDSDESEVREIVPKRICKICNKKFSGNLILYRHMQLVHNRKSQQTPAQTEQDSSKISKKVSPKSAVLDNSNVESNASRILKKVSPKSTIFDNTNDELDTAKNLKKVTPKSAVSDNSNVESNTSKLLKKVSPKPTILDKTNEESDAAKILKKVSSKSLVLDNSNEESDSAKISKKFSLKSNNSNEDRNTPVKPDSLGVKKPVHHKNCPICKQKFDDSFNLHRHIKSVHSRRSTQTVIVKSEPLDAAISPVKSKKKLLHNRSALSRVCRKPLPPMKRKWMKKEQPSK